MQILLNGLCNGMVIALLAIAYTVVYLPTRIFFIALAGIYVGCAYLTWEMLGKGIHVGYAIGLSVALGATLSVLCELFNHRALEKHKASDGAHMISSLGIYMIMIQAVAIIWGNEPKILKTGLETTYHLMGFTVASSQVINLVAASIAVGGFFLWLKRSSLGLLFRGLADNPTQMALLGYDTNRLRLVAFGLSGAMAGFAGILSAYDLGFDPYTGMNAVLLAVIATIIGGKTNFVGPLLGGLILGILRAEVVWFYSARWQEAITFVILVVFLFLKPDGLLAKEGRLESRE